MSFGNEMGIFIPDHAVCMAGASLCLGRLKYKANPNRLAQGLQSRSMQAPCLLSVPRLGLGQHGPTALCHPTGSCWLPLCPTVPDTLQHDGAAELPAIPEGPGACAWTSSQVHPLSCRRW